jgi:hypothetical protein
MGREIVSTDQARALGIKPMFAPKPSVAALSAGFRLPARIASP